MLKRVCLWILLAYATIVVLFVARQRNLIYQPKADGAATPTQYGVMFEDLYLKANGSPDLHAWWVPQAKVEHRPALLYCHGNAATLSELSHVAAIFHELGVQALLFDYRNFGRSARDPASLSEQRLLDDAQRAYDWIKQAGFADREILIWGHSLGAAVAAQLARRNAPAGLILEGPFTSLWDMARHRYPWLLVPPFLIWDKFDNLSAIAQLNLPVLVMHAENDSIVPHFMGEQIFQTANSPKKFILLKGINHNDFPEVYKEYLPTLRDFIAAVTK